MEPVTERSAHPPHVDVPTLLAVGAGPAGTKRRGRALPAASRSGAASCRRAAARRAEEKTPPATILAARHVGWAAAVEHRDEAPRLAHPAVRFGRDDFTIPAFGPPERLPDGLAGHPPPERPRATGTPGLVPVGPFAVDRRRPCSRNRPSAALREPPRRRANRPRTCGVVLAGHLNVARPSRTAFRLQGAPPAPAAFPAMGRRRRKVPGLP